MCSRAVKPYSESARNPIKSQKSTLAIGGSVTEIDLAMESDSLNLIMSQLTHLRTKEQLFKELIQNADDAEATSISFHFSREGLLVSNDAK